jgi:hypothetical protein
MNSEQLQRALMNAYEAAVVHEARRRGGNPKHFGEAASMLPADVFEALRDAYRKQIESLPP